MITLPGYSIDGLIYKSSKSAVYRAVEDHNKKPVIVKIFNLDYPSQEDLARIRREYEIAGELDFKGILHPVALVPFQQSYALILEDFGGIALDTIMADHKIDLLSFMKIAIKLADVLGEIHQTGIVHKDIKPSNILVNEKKGESFSVIN